MGLADTLYGPLSSAGSPPTSANQPPEVVLSKGTDAGTQPGGLNSHPTLALVVMLGLAILVLHTVVHGASLAATLKVD